MSVIDQIVRMEPVKQATWLKLLLSNSCRRLQFAVYVDYDDVNTAFNQYERSFHVLAKHPTTNELRLRRKVTLKELQTEEGMNKLLSQLWLAEPST